MKRQIITLTVLMGFILLPIRVKADNYEICYSFSSLGLTVYNDGNPCINHTLSQICTRCNNRCSDESEDNYNLCVYECEKSQIEIFNDVACDNEDIKGFSGWEELNIKYLSLQNNSIESIDLSKYNYLYSVNLKGNALKEIKLNNQIKTLDVTDNNLTDLDVSGLKELKTLSVDSGVNVIYAKFDNKLEIDGNKIYGVSLNTSLNEVEDNLITIYNSNFNPVYTNNNQTLTDNSLIGTGTILTVGLDSFRRKYTFIVKGDVTGTGDITISDVSKAYQYIKGKIKMNDEYIKAADVAGSDGVIMINDISKLYNYIKGKVSSL